jgi:hypothetical protein
MAVFSIQTVLPVSGLTNLQSLSGSAGDIAIAAGDDGGGQFYFEPASGSTTITSVTQAHARIDSTSFMASPITVTAAGHPFVTGQAVLLSGTGGADGTWIVTRIDSNSFTLNGSVGDSVTTTKGGDANSVMVTTALPHGRAVDQRLAIAGAGWSPPTASIINGQWNNLSVTGPTTLTIGALLTGLYRRRSKGGLDQRRGRQRRRACVCGSAQRHSLPRHTHYSASVEDLVPARFRSHAG